ncbi:MAG: hypothetical protein U0836_17960 [Pirellulales bacterium]
MKTAEKSIAKQRADMAQRRADLKARILSQPRPLSDHERLVKARILIADIVTEAFDNGGDIPIPWLDEVAELLAIDLPCTCDDD